MEKNIKNNLETIINCLYSSNIAYLEPETIVNIWEKNIPDKKNFINLLDNSILNNNDDEIYCNSYKFLNNINIIKKPYYITKKRNNITYCQAVFFETKNKLIISCNGLKTIKDLYYCLKFNKTDVNHLIINNENISIHNGFLDLYQLIQNYILIKCYNYIDLYPNREIVFCGHSLGGALSSIAALNLKIIKNNYKITSCTFGTPKIGNKNFTKSFNKYIKNSFVFINHDDPIPILPYSFNYEYTDCVIYMNKDNEVIYNNNINTTFNSLFCLMSKYFKTHKMLYYYHQIIKNFT
jgi:hypothetical protein